jgi:thiamine-monophosphate kinase
MEAELISHLRKMVSAHRSLEVPIGDDAAVVKTSPRTVVTVDMLTDGVDFVVGQVDPVQIGYKALAVNLSDLAAMAAQPLAALISVALPDSGGLELAKSIYAGIGPLAKRFNLAIAGGDTNSWSGPLAISITLLGTVTEYGPLLRSGAKTGDRILVTGQFGGSILARHMAPEPRVNEALYLNSHYRLHAGIDVSDGLSIDLDRMARESGLGAELDLSRVPIAPAAEKLADQSDDRSTALDHALGDGEDFELILAVAPEVASQLLRDQPLDGVELTDIGQFIETPGLWRLDPDSGRSELAVSGWLH